MLKYIWCYLLFSCILQHVSAQSTADSTIRRLEAINRDIWIPFSKAYALADAELYISLHRPDFIRASAGGAQIFGLSRYAAESREGFRRGQEKGFKTQISFRFLERLVSAEFASERGIYHYYSENASGEKHEGYGKFHVVERFENGRWKLLFDYDSSENGSIGKPDFEAAFGLDDWSVIKR